jgi:hypothetical protein
VFARARPRLGVAHHLTVNAASRAAIVQDIRRGYPEARGPGRGAFEGGEGAGAGLAAERRPPFKRGQVALSPTPPHPLPNTPTPHPHPLPPTRPPPPQGDIIINEDLNVYDVTPAGVEVRRRLVPERSWGFWHAESNWQARGGGGGGGAAAGRAAAGGGGAPRRARPQK